MNNEELAKALIKFAQEGLSEDHIKALKEARHNKRYAHSSRLMSIINAKKLKERLKLDSESEQKRLLG